MATSRSPELPVNTRSLDTYGEVADAAFHEWKRLRALETTATDQERAEKVRFYDQFLSERALRCGVL